MKRKIAGSVTVEAAFLVPIIFMVIAVVIQILFYYHDKNVIKGIAHETVVVCSSMDEILEEDIENYFYDQLGNKLFLFPYVELEVLVEDELIQVSCHSKRGMMQVNTFASMKRTTPETWIRRVRFLKRLENLGE